MEAGYYNAVLMDAPFGYANHRILLDENGVPVDYVFLEVNKAYENFTGLKAANIVGKTVRQVLPGIENDEFNWIAFFGNVALTQSKEVVEQYSNILDRWYKVFVSSPEKGFFSTLFLESTHEQVFAEASKELSEFRFENIDYSKIAGWMRTISGADYVVLNKFEKNGKEFTTMATAGLSENIAKAVKIMGFDLVGKKWDYDARREQMIKDHKITRFSSIRTLAENVFPFSVISLMETTFNLGDLVIVKTTKDDKMVGDFTLIFKKNHQLQNRAIVESFAELTGNTLARIDVEQQLVMSEEKYRLIAENSSDVIWISDLDLNFTYLSPSTQKLFGYTPDERDEISIEKLFHPDKIAMIKNLIREQFILYLNSGKHEGIIMETTGIHKNGSPVDIEVSAKFIFDQNQQIIGIQGISRNIAERNKVEDELRKSEEKYKLLVETATDSVFLLNDEGIITEINNAALINLGYQRDEIIGQTVHFIDPGFSTKDFLDFWKKQPFNHPLIFESKHRRKDGSYISVEISSQKFLQNKKTFYYGIARDISERKKAEKRFQALIENAPDGVAIVNIQGMIIYASPNAIRHFGYEFEETVGRYGNEFTHPDDLPAVYEVLEKVMKDPSQKVKLQYRFRKKSGEYLWIETTFSNLLYDDAVQGIVMNFTDITERERIIGELTEAKNKAEKNETELLKINNELKERNLFIQTILDNLPIGLSLNYIDEGDAIYMNRKFEEVYGWNKEELTSVQTFFEKVYPDKKYRDELIQKVMTDIQSGDKERMHWENIFVTCKDGTKKVINAVNIPLFDQNTMVSTVTEVTDLYNTQTDLIKAKEKAEEADRLKTAFLANMSHEIRTPMNGILGFTELLADSHFTGEEKRDFINIIRKSGQRMLNTVNDLIDISKIETGQMQVVLTETNLREQVLNLYNFFKPEASEKLLDFRLSENINPAVALVRTDVPKLDSIMTNLIKNALKYTDSGFVEIRVSLTGNVFTFSVSDSGIGIPEERKHAIFNRFEQADIEDSRALQGSGLGLAIMRAYVVMLGGTIKLESEVGKGSEFTVTIPVEGISGQKVSDATTVNNDAQPSKPHLKILIAEDDPVGDQYLTILLSELKADVLHAINGQDAVEICRENTDIDIVMMDIRMPVMDGYEATRQIRAFNREVVIIAQTAFALSGDREKALEAGCNDHISKPIKKQDLMQVIGKVLNKIE